MIAGVPVRWLKIAVAVIIGWILLAAYAGSLFLVCAAVAAWRLWSVAAGAPMPVRGTPHAGQLGRREPDAAGAAPVRPPRSLDQAMAELDGMIGLTGVKEEIAKLVDVLQAERERARLGHRASVPSLHCVFLGNAGLRSRFTRTITFADYDPGELVAIYRGLASGDGFRLSAAAEDALVDACADLVRGKDRTFGNGRTMRTLWERTREAQAGRVMRHHDRTPDDLVTIDAADIDDAAAVEVTV